MDALLSQVSTRYNKRPSTAEPLLQEASRTQASSSNPSTAPARAARTGTTVAANTTEEALETLRSEPGYDALAAVLRFLLTDDTSVDVRQPTPLSAQIVQVLVTAILPNYWLLFHEDDEDDEDDDEGGKGVARQPTDRRRRRNTDLGRFLACLRSIGGISAILVRLRALVAEAKTRRSTAGADDQTGHPAWQLRILLDALSELLVADDAVAQVWAVSTAGADDDAKKRPLVQEFVGLLGGGRVVSLAAEAEAVAQETTAAERSSPTWVASGTEYSRWLARGVIEWALHDVQPESRKVQGTLLGKALRLGYPDAVISTFISDLVLGNARSRDDVLGGLIGSLAVSEQKKVLSGVLKYAAETYFVSGSADPATVDGASVSAVAGLIRRIVGTSAPLREQLASWILTNGGLGLVNGIAIRRAAMAVVAEKPSDLSDILDRCIAEFGDQLFIKHTSILQQEVKAQVLLLCAGYSSRQAPRSLTSLLRSRAYLSMVSNRLSASQTRAKFLGMVVGEALSSLIDNSKQRLDFHMDEMSSDDALWYKGLVHVSDPVGSPGLLKQETPATKSAPARTKYTKPQAPRAAARTAHRPPAQPKTTGFIIEEVDDDKEAKDAEDGDLVAYGKPDSDAEDSDDDPTLLRRDKPKAPVYIRDLMAYFRDTENYDKQKLAVTTAPLLIRRKATFGTEVQEHAQELASILIGLHDPFDMDDFAQLRLHGMVALVVAQPRSMGPYYAQTYFDGDYSLAQRASVLTALGLGARELAGFDVSDYAAAAAFPSKQLPQRIERLYVPSAGSQPGNRPSGDASSLKALPPGALDSVADSLTASFLRPIAAKAADEATGPDVLKLVSFRSRVQQSQAVREARGGRAARAKAVANTAGPVLASSFFFPLVARFQLALQAAASARMRSILLEPTLLALYLKTLAVVLHAAGPGALALPDMTAELWALLLSSSVQARCAGDVLVTHAVLFAVMALLDVNEHRMRELCRDLPREVVQTRDWALQVLETMRHIGADAAPAGSQEGELQMLAAGAYIRITEGMESYKNLLLGEMIG